jgi:hypothetical protein
MTKLLQHADPDLITRTLLRDAMQWFGVQNARYRRTVVSKFLELTLPRFSSIVSSMDEVVGQQGFVAGVNWMLPHLQMSVTGHGVDNVPRSGPVLIASNHPGGADFLVIFSQVPRDDVRLVAAVEQLDLLPNVVKHIVYTSRTRGKKAEKGATTKRLIEELAQAHLVLIYPRGIMEPDPRWSAGGRANLQQWSHSFERFAEAVPDLTIVPTLVAGSTSRRAFDQRWLTLYRSERARQRVATFVQVLLGMSRPTGWEVNPHVWFGEPVRVADYAPEGVRPRIISEVDHLFSYARSPDWPLRASTFGWLKK